MKKIFVALAAVTLMLSLFAIVAFASTPQPVIKDTGSAIAMDQVTGTSAGSATYLAKFDIKTIGLLDSGQTYVLGAMDSGGTSGILGKIIVQSQGMTNAYINNTKTTAPIIATDLTGKTIIAKTMLDPTEERCSTYAEPRGSYVIAKTGSGTLVLL